MNPLYTVYIACFGEEGGVARATLFDDGTLQSEEFVQCPSPLYLALENNRLHALLCDPFGTGESGMVTIPLGWDGTMEAAGEVYPTGGGEACYLSFWNGDGYIANYQTGSVSRLSKDGERLVRLHEGHGADSERQEAPHPHYIAPSPDGRFLLCADLGTDTVITYDRHLNPLFTANVPAGSGARHLAFSADGKAVYCVNEMGNTVTVFAYDNGRLTPLETVDALPGEHGESYAAAIRRWGEQLIISHRGDDSLTVFGAEGTRLIYREKTDCGGKWPRDFNVFGDFLIGANQQSDTVTVFRRQNGHLKRGSSLSLPRPLCVVGCSAVKPAYSQVESAVFLRRPNRFIAVVDRGGTEETVHVKNTGRCRELLVPGTAVVLAKSNHPARKTRYDLVAVEKQRVGKPPLLINMDSQLPNEAAAEWLPRSGLFSDSAVIRREVFFGDSRFDFYIEDGSRRAFLEVKGVTLEQDGVALFPDAPTQRGVKHLRELCRAADEGYEAYVLFVIQMKEMRVFRPNADTHPAFAAALKEAADCGVRVLAMDSRVSKNGMTIDRAVPVELTDKREC